MSQPQPPQQQKKKLPNDQIDGEMSQWIQAAGSHHTFGMTVEQLHSLIAERNSSLFESFDKFMEAAAEGSQTTEKRYDDWKSQGAQAFKQKQFEKAVLCYTRATHDTTDRNKLAILYTNRATCLYNMELYEHSVLDANRAVAENPQYQKAYYRRGHALAKLNCDEELCNADISHSEHSSLEDVEHPKGTEIAELVNKVADKDRERRTEPKPTIMEGSFIDVVHIPGIGRRVIAKKDIDAGTPVIVEDATAALIKNEHVFTHCDWCLHHTPNLYPSAHHENRRSRGLYCSDTCANHAWERYGEVESKSPFFLVCPLDILLAFRLIMQYPSQLMLDPSAEKTVGGWSWKMPSDNSAYLKSLEGHTRETEKTLLHVGGHEAAATVFAYHCGAIGLLYKKVTNTPASDSLPLNALWEMSETVRRAMQQILTNGISVSKLLRLNTNEAGLHSIEQRKVATAIFPFSSLVNHSCDPNCVLNFVGGPHSAFRRVNLRATRSIIKGTELTICYGPHKNKIHSVKNRREALQNQYNFLCNCEACLSEKEEPVCEVMIDNSSSSSHCNHIFPQQLTEEKEELMVKASTYYQKGRRMLREGRHRDAIPALEASLDILLKEIFIGKHRTSFVVSRLTIQ
eukprot:TRINITY_DN7574_c0_g1_i1.p1 TRINITY_DN7574_c0_g1~~TRINITY_DN7574_c0_g1_i1.p1  ORF type:complete len:627 (+),score=117.98 TRINITY_DN7574_c0_g1_i1:48-1928(+)